MKHLFFLCYDYFIQSFLFSDLNLIFRDLFYEFLREWQENRLTQGWTLQDALGVRIQQLVSDSVSLTNHIHFCRLFVSQLIQVSSSQVIFSKKLLIYVNSSNETLIFDYECMTPYPLTLMSMQRYTEKQLKGDY